MATDASTPNRTRYRMERRALLGGGIGFALAAVPGARVPESVLERMRRAEARGDDHARAEGVQIAQEVLEGVRDIVQGVQVSTSGRPEVAVEAIGGKTVRR